MYVKLCRVYIINKISPISSDATELVVVCKVVQGLYNHHYLSSLQRCVGIAGSQVYSFVAGRRAHRDTGGARGLEASALA